MAREHNGANLNWALENSMANSARDKNAKVSVVLSFRNEAEVIDELIERLVKVFKADGCPYELIFVNDVSTDNSLELLKKHASENKNVKILDMARNSGVSECVLAGIEYSTGEAVVYMDTDLQDPPEVIPELMAKWREGADMVFTHRISRDGEAAYRLFFTGLAYKIINWFSEIDLPHEAGDFRLLSRRAADQMLALPESSPYLRGMAHWIGFNRAEVPYRREARAAGQSHFPGVFTRGPIKVFTDGITAFSMFPLYLVLYVGLAGTTVGFGGLLMTVLAAAIWGWCGVAGWLFFAISLWGTLMLGIGIVALYMSRVYRDVRGRPRYIVKDTINL